MACAPVGRSALHEALPTAESPAAGVTGAAAHRMVAPSLNVTVAVEMSPLVVSVAPAAAALSTSPARSVTCALLPPSGIVAVVSPKYDVRASSGVTAIEKEVADEWPSPSLTVTVTG